MSKSFEIDVFTPDRFATSCGEERNCGNWAA